MGSSYKQALLSNPNDNELECQKNANEAMDKDVREGFSNNSKIITQPLDNAQCRPIYVGKLTSQVLSCRSFMDDDEEIASSLRPFDGPLETELQLHEKSEQRKLFNKDKKSGRKISKSSHNSPTPTEIVKEDLDLGKKFGISVIGDETPTTRRITRSLMKKLKTNDKLEIYILRLFPG